MTVAAERIGFDDLAAGLEHHFLRAGTAPWVARILARNCAACERDGEVVPEI